MATQAAATNEWIDSGQFTQILKNHFNETNDRISTPPNEDGRMSDAQLGEWGLADDYEDADVLMGGTDT